MLGNHLPKPQPRSWVLVVEPTTEGTRRIGGLPLALRLALDAQGAGASAIVVYPTASELLGALGDARLRLPVLPEAPSGTLVLKARASLLVHRESLRQLAAAASLEQHVVDLGNVREAPTMPYAFAPIDVTGDPAARIAERQLFRSLRKAQDGWTSRWLNRYISLAISRWLVKTPLRPNQVSVAILAVGLAGGLVASRGGYVPLLLGACLFQAQSVLDGCDGEMSRVSHRGSRLGEWLDTIGDDLTNYGFFAGAAVGLFRMTQQPLYLAAGGLTVACGFLASGLEYRYLIRIGSGDLLQYPLSQAGAKGALAFLTPLFKRDTFVFLTLLFAVAGALGPMLCVFSLAAVGILISVLKTELRLAQEARGSAMG